MATGLGPPPHWPGSIVERPRGRPRRTLVSRNLMNPDISVVVPMRNEAPNVEELCAELVSTLAASGRSFEIIAVDDGSTDETFELLARAQARESHLRVIRFRRNFGQTAAFAAGFAHARGRYIVTIDGDGQNDPRDISGMIEMSEAGAFDIVCGWRKDRKDPFLNRRLPSMIANRLISLDDRHQAQ